VSRGESAGQNLAKINPTSDGSAETAVGRTLHRWRDGLLSMPGAVRTWLVIFALSLCAFLIRFLVPSPVAQADNRDGPRLLCGIGLVPLRHGLPRYFRYAYMTYVHSPSCAGRAPYPSSQLGLLAIARVLTPVLGLAGSLSMVALGVVTCVVASVGIASLAVGLRVRVWAQVLIAAIVWVVVADAAFFDVFAGPFSEPAAIVGLLLVAGGAVYLGRGWRLTVFGLVLAGAGGGLAILSKEQYLILAAPICLTIVLASARPGRWRDVHRFLTREGKAALAVAALLATMTAAYIGWDYTSHYGKRLHYIQAVDMIFTDIVTKRADAPAQLRALGLPVSWAKYAGHYFWDTAGSVRTSPLLPRYEDKLTDTTIAHYLVTHPGSIFRIGQNAAKAAQRVRVTALGDYPASAGHPPRAIESRVVVFTWLMHQLPSGLGLFWYVPVWLVVIGIALTALIWSRRRPWNRDGAVVVLCMTGCAFAAFIPPSYFAGISTTRHMVGMNLATAIALTIAVGLAVSMSRQALSQRRQARAGPDALARARPEVVRRSA
jgi:hypothetical protein